MENKLSSAVKNATAANSPNKKEPKSVFNQKNLHSAQTRNHQHRIYKSIDCESGGGLILHNLNEYTSNSIMMDRTRDLLNASFNKKHVLSQK
jgi:hypothetical protein